MMKSSPPGTGTSPIEVTNISAHGLWLLVNQTEYFLAYSDFPWFRQAKLDDILKVELHHGEHFYWPQLDVDLSLDCVLHPEKYPRVSVNP